MIRVARHRFVPLHFDASPLESWVDLVGWPTAIALCTAGLVLFVRAISTVVEAAAALLIMIGGSLVMALVRCRRYEVSVNDRLVEMKVGPFRHCLPAGCVEAAVAGPATSWRRFFADRELELTLSGDSRTVRVPTRDENELRRVLLDTRV